MRLKPTQPRAICLCLSAIVLPEKGNLSADRSVSMLRRTGETKETFRPNFWNKNKKLFNKKKKNHESSTLHFFFKFCLCVCVILLQRSARSNLHLRCCAWLPASENAGPFLGNVKRKHIFKSTFVYVYELGMCVCGGQEACFRSSSSVLSSNFQQKGLTQKKKQRQFCFIQTKVKVNEFHLYLLRRDSNRLYGKYHHPTKQRKWAFETAVSSFLPSVFLVTHVHRALAFTFYTRDQKEFLLQLVQKKNHEKSSCAYYMLKITGKY